MISLNELESIISDFPNFSIEKGEQTENKTFSLYPFTAYDKNFSLLFLSHDYEYTMHMPYITLRNSTITHPHFMITELPIENDVYRNVCLYQENQYIFSNMTRLDKVYFLFENLEKLLSMNKMNIEKEYQKEFLYYWNNSSNIHRNNIYHSFVSNSVEAKKIKIMKSKTSNSITRLTDDNKLMNDEKEWKLTNDHGIYIPIPNIKGILPPINKDGWNKKDFLYILKNIEEDKISVDNFDKLKIMKVKKEITIVFSMEILNTIIQFACKLTFKTNDLGYLFNKIENELNKVEHLRLVQKGFEYLCQSIGTPTNLLDKRIGIIGAGSLGSYIAEELINAGSNNLIIYDKDSLIDHNIFRHRLSSKDLYESKSRLLATKLQEKHPEVEIDFFEENVNEENFDKLIVNNNLDYLIITVGTTDVQKDLEILINNIDKNLITVFIWLEANGEDSYAIFSDNNKRSLIDWESLYSNSEYVIPNLIHDVCGGTRVGYGNRTLLSAVNMLLYGFYNLENSTYPSILKSSINGGITIIKENNDTVGENEKV